MEPMNVESETPLEATFEAGVIDAKMFADLKEALNCDCFGSIKKAISSISCDCCSCDCSSWTCSLECFSDLGALKVPSICEPLTNAVSAIYRYMTIFIVGIVLHVQEMIFGCESPAMEPMNVQSEETPLEA